MFGLNKIVLGVGILSIALLILGGWYYHKTTQKEILELRQYNTILEVRNKNLVALKEAIEATNEINELKIRELNEARKKDRERIVNLRQTLSEHDLETLAREKPYLIEKIIDEATKRAFDDIELDTAR